MTASIAITAQDNITPRLQALLGGLRDRTRLHGMMGRQVAATTRDYLRGLAATRHATARRLGATPTGHLARAAESVTSTADNVDATVTITSPGISRARRDITITPRRGKYLTIPAHPRTYGKRAGEFDDLKFIPFRRTPALAWVEGTGRNRRTTIAYWLKNSITQRQDSTLLPSAALITQSATEGAKDYLRRLISNQRSAIRDQ
jgi:hypothetical protein